MEQVHSLCFVSGDAGVLWLGRVGIGESFLIIYLPSLSNRTILKQEEEHY